MIYHKNKLIEHVIKSIENASAGISKLNNEILNLEGMSSAKVRHLLNNLCSLPNTKYLEIGTFKGSTFISALYKNQQNIEEAIVIDNWSYFESSKETFTINTSNFLEKNSFKLYESDCFKLDLLLIDKNSINIYFYDGNHTFESHKAAFRYFNDVFADTFIAVVDDYNWDHVKKGTQEIFQELKYNILFDEYLSSNSKNDKKGWWNGVYIAVISKK